MLNKYIKVGNIYKLEQMPNNTHDFKKYKSSKIYIEHLEAILKVINLSILGLSHFELYSPVHRILVTMRLEKKLLERALEEQKKIKANKGKNK